MNFDDHIFRWIKNVGAQDMSLDPTYKHNREMCTLIFSVHKNLFFMRKLRGHDADAYLRYMNLCQDSLARIEFLCALSGLDTEAPALSRIFMKMAQHEHVNYLSASSPRAAL